MRFCHRLGCILLLLPLQLSAQQPTAPTLKQVLERVQQNYAIYLRTVPNLYADENLVSSLVFPRGPVDTLGGATGGERVSYNSIFRLKRTSAAGEAGQELQETRQVVSVDHHPAMPQQALEAPNLIAGAFSYAPKVLVAGVAPCFDYKLRPNRRWRGRTVVVVEYVTLRAARLAPAGCRNDEAVSGRILIDSASWQIVRFEQTRPKHTPPPQTGKLLQLSPEANGVWTWSIDYAMVTLEGHSFWLPKTITSTFEIQANRNVLWSFQSSYTHYQLADVHSRILLPDGSALPSP